MGLGEFARLGSIPVAAEFRGGKLARAEFHSRSRIGHHPFLYFH
jgi:hypothetical protein